MRINKVRMTKAHYSPGKNTDRSVTIHATAGTNSYAWLRDGGGSGASRVSCHYLIARTGVIYQYTDVHGGPNNPDELIMWHAGISSWVIDGKRINENVGLNHCSIGIELENLNNCIQDYPKAQYDACVELTKHLIHKYKIPLNQVVRHVDISPGRKTDPRCFPWEQFKSDLTLPAKSISPTKKLVRVSIINKTPVNEGWDINSPIALGGHIYLLPGQIVEVQSEADVNGTLRYHMADGTGFFTAADSRIIRNSEMPIVGGPMVDLFSQKMVQNTRIIEAYDYLGRLTGLGNIWPFAQACLETAYFTSARWVINNNPAGLGATDDGAVGAVFPTLEAGILAQYAHLLAYATLPGNPLFDQLVVFSPRLSAMEQAYGRGSSPSWQELTGRWATDPDYYTKIERIVKAMMTQIK